MRRTVTPRRLELKPHLPSSVELHPLANGRQLAYFAAQLRRLAQVDRERYRLLRSSFSRSEEDQQQIEQLRMRVRRQNLALDALSDALEHAKRAQRVADQRVADQRIATLNSNPSPSLQAGSPASSLEPRGPSARFGGSGRRSGVSPGAPSGPAVSAPDPPERIVEAPVERVVYRDREFRVEVPFSVPRALSPRGGPSARRRDEPGSGGPRRR